MPRKLVISSINFPFGWGEINGTHNRTDYDLSRHQEYSGVSSMEYLDPETNEKFIPYIIESTVWIVIVYRTRYY